VIITEPGVYDIPAREYHADPWPGGSLSHSGARKLLPPGCPAHFRHWVDHGEAPRDEWDFGHAAHSLVLGVGEPLEIVDADSWQTKAAQVQRKIAYAAGKVPLLRKDLAKAEAMAEVVYRHPYAGELLSEPGKPEQSMFWPDTSGITRRARLDYLGHSGDEFVVDYKTCNSSSPEAIARAMWNYGYYQQAPWYQDAVVGVGLLEDWPEFLFIFQEKTPPYIVTVASPDEEMLAYGRARNREAIDVYYRCKTFDHWPGYADGPVTVSLPRWAHHGLDAEVSW
jgi:hypothetical protein